MAVQSPLTTEEFEAWVRLPENAERHFELINGEMVEKMASQQKHSSVPTLLCSSVSYPTAPMSPLANPMSRFTAGSILFWS